MFKFHFNFKRVLPLLFISICCLTIIGASYFLLPPKSNPDNLGLMLLNPETEPVFKVTHQLSYSHDSVNTLLSTEDYSISNTEQKQLNLLIQLDESSTDFSTLPGDLEKLTPYFSHFSLSILPSNDMTDKAYISQCEKLSNTLHINSSLNFSLLAYPSSSSNLSLYNADFIDGVGTVLKNEDDLKLLEKVYGYFSSKKELFVRDDIIRFYKEEAQVAAQEINKLYYMLAIKYPDVTTIFSPYADSPLNLVDDYALDHSSPDYYLFYTIYSRLLEKPWLTASEQSVTSTSPYTALNSYDVVSMAQAAEDIELILAPEQQILKDISKYRTTSGASPYLIFKCNNSYLPVTASYPYTITLNSSELPNGISRITAILQDTSLNTLSTYSIDVTVDIPVLKERAERIHTPGVSYTTDSKGTAISSAPYIPILMYHTVSDTVSAEDQNSCVETKVFDSQMKALLDAGYTPINFYDLKCYIDGNAELPNQPIIITMDDGYLNNYTHAYPIYKKYQIQATLFISPYYVQQENTERHFGWKAAQEMEQSGLIDIQAHGYDHTPFPYLSIKDLKYHITQAQGLIEMNLGSRDVSVVACPQFRNTRFTRKVLSDLGVDFQITKLATKGTLLTPPILRRINVPNTMAPDELITTIKNIVS